MSKPANRTEDADDITMTPQELHVLSELDRLISLFIYYYFFTDSILNELIYPHYLRMLASNNAYHNAYNSINNVLFL